MLDLRSARSLVLAVASGNVLDNRKSLWARAARVSGVSIRTIKSIWYGEISRESHLAVRTLRATAATRAATLSSRYQKWAVALEQANPHKYSADVAALLDAADALEAVRDSLDMHETGPDGGKSRS